MGAIQHSKMWRLPILLEMSVQIRNEVQEMLKVGIITPSDSPRAAPVVLVDKPDGSIRFFVDYQKLNHVTKANAYPMPLLDDLIETIGRCHFITFLDMIKGYYQVKMYPGDQEKTAFRSPLGLYEFKVMAFGLKNAPATFQRLVDGILHGLGEFTVAYLDDIAIFSQTWSEHKEHLELVLQRIKETGLTIKASKCQIGDSEIKYLGHMVGGGIIKPSETKVEAITNWPIPTSKKKVRAFLGLAGFYRNFFPKFSELAAPLTNLTRKKEPESVEGTSAGQQSFDALKNSLTTGPVLIAPNHDLEFTIFTDASNAGIRAMLCQPGEEDNLHPIMYVSKKLLPREKHLSTIEKDNENQ
ncbi:Hypothetical predicted protein [Podarcis lilfordi]|uniref:ribonuclease H n=1 Tax=Podarcis lilfordi TaxID=74358 RepID=A0AA35P6B8_9SAUR|nr:Hypothetical predicted protein [Podarcis lilfordi]